MEFREATDRLTAAIRLSDLAREVGVSESLVRKARMSGTGEGTRSPPAGWQAAAARLARRRARELEKLAAELVGE